MNSNIDIFKNSKKETGIVSNKPDMRFVKAISLGREKAKVRWFSNNVQFSKHYPELKFTNFLSSNIGHEIKNRLLEVKSDISCLNKYEHRPVTDLEKHSRYKKILSKHLEDISIDDCHGLIYKFQCKNLAGASASIRFYFLYEVHPKTNEYYQSIFLIDPFHLVIPSSDRRGKKRLNAEQILEIDYNTNKCNRNCLSLVLNS